MRPAEVRFHPAALDEVEAAFRWYRERSPVAAAAFLAELDRTIALLAEMPGRPALYLHDTRRILLRRYPYAVVYRVTDEAVEVIAVAHGRRRPGYWRTR